ncbi:MAG: HAD family hydrolase [Candidatus Acidiferrales bacterium]
MQRERQVLLIDADDTLWEENLHFEQAIEDFVALAAPLGYPPEHVRRRLDLTERRNILERGYGAWSFALTLEEVYLELTGERADKAHVEEIRRIARLLQEEPRQLYDGVAETLAYLVPRHRLFLFTKGHAGEQGRKVEMSGLQAFFEACTVVEEKNEDVYRAMLERQRLESRGVWMVGNSPRSDINPALAAGMNAVYIPSARSWDYEREEIRAGSGELLRLKSFRELQEHF